MTAKDIQPASGMSRPARTAALAAALVALAGCASIGPGSVPRDRVGYANALSDSWKEQMLLNIVRLRYADAPTFLDVSSVISAYTLQAGAQAGGTLNLGTPSNTTTLPNAQTTLGVAGGFNDRPTISYMPLAGRKFAQSLLQPIPPLAIFSLIAAGYPVDVVIPVTVRALNGVYNRASQAGETRSADPAFYDLVEAWRRIQVSRTFSTRIEEHGDDQVVIGVFAPRLEPEVRQDVEFLSGTLGLRAENGEITLTSGALPRAPDELAVLSRSMIEIMVELAADVDVPMDHVTRGRTFASTARPAGTPTFDMPHVNVHSGPAAPPDAFASILYRGTWYWVSDEDYRSKRSLTFLLLFFSLAETGVTPDAPVLTIPVQ